MTGLICTFRWKVSVFDVGSSKRGFGRDGQTYGSYRSRAQCCSSGTKPVTHRSRHQVLRAWHSNISFSSEKNNIRYAYFKLFLVNVHHTKLNGKSAIGISLHEKGTFGLVRKWKIAWSFCVISVKSALIPEKPKTVTSSVWTRMLSLRDVGFTAHGINRRQTGRQTFAQCF